MPSCLCVCVCVSQCCWVNHTWIGVQIQEQLIKKGSQSGIRAKLAEQGQKHGTTILGKRISWQNVRFKTR